MDQQQGLKLLEAGLISQEVFDRNFSNTPAAEQVSAAPQVPTASSIADPGAAVARGIGSTLVGAGDAVATGFGNLGQNLSSAIAPEAAAQLAQQRTPAAAQPVAEEPTPTLKLTPEQIDSQLAEQENKKALIEQAAAQAEDNKIKQLYGSQLKQAERIKNETLNILAQEEKLRDDSITQLADIDKKRQEQQDQIQQTIDTEFEAVKQKFSELENEKIDPDAYWKRSGTWDNVRNTLGIILGGIGQSLAGGENQGLKMINEQINRDIAAQEKNIDLKSKRANQSLNLFQNYQNILKNKQDAASATRMEYLERYKMSLDKMAARYKKPEIEQNYLNFRNQIDAQIATERAKLEASRERKAINQVLSGNPGAVKEEQQLAVIDQLQQSPEKSDRERAADLRDRYLPGYGISTANKETVGKFRDYANEVKPALSALDRVIKYSNGIEYNRLIPEDRAQVETEMAAIVGALRLPITGPGVLTETERELLTKIVGNPNKIFSLPGVEQKRLMTMKQKLNSDLTMRAKDSGFKVPTANVTTFKPR